MKLGDGNHPWELECAEERQSHSPDTCRIPSLEERRSVKAGQQVELFFYFRGRDIHGPFVQNERLWVTVKEVLPSGYVGELERRPKSSRALDAGETVWFEPRHIGAIRRATGN